MSDDGKKPCEGAHDIVWTRGRRARCKRCGFDLATLIALTDFDPFLEEQRKMLDDWAEPVIVADTDDPKLE